MAQPIKLQANTLHGVEEYRMQTVYEPKVFTDPRR